LSPEDHARIAARARANAMGNFTLAALQTKTLAVYDELLGSALANAFQAKMGSDRQA
jgi:hypothetical protein